MKNRSLTKDYVTRAGIRFAALQVLLDKGGYADVVREAQEIVELLSKSLIRHLGAEPARVHDVSAQLRELRSRLQPELHSKLDALITHSRELRRDRELAFYGTEDLTPSEFYSKEDAERAFGYASESLAFVQGLVS
ncbi:MAG: HEPN domain-containing protein [Pseudomonadota bacterium]|jgi:HEPN domain-containing protein